MYKRQAQDIVETGFFTESYKYTDFYKTLHDLWKEIAPKRAAFNFSEDDPYCDGLTVGRFQKVLDALSDLPKFEIVSSETFIPTAKERANEN